MTGPVAPTLPIKNRSTVPTGGGRTPKKGGGASSKNREGGNRGGHKSWADFTPTPWLDYAPTPWSNTAAGMPPYGSVFMGKEKGKKDAQHEAAMAAAAAAAAAGAAACGAWPSTPTPTPKSWGATPTPSSGGSLPQTFGFPGMPPPMMGMPPFMPPGFMAQMAEAAAAAAGAAAAAAAAAGQASVDSSPDEQRRHDSYSHEAYDSPPWAQQAPGPPPMHTVSSSNLPSKGSSIHGTGKCRPCAWFWKPSGCQSGADCNYCHMCPEGELKNRKKLKVAAMRMGALAPAQPGTAPGAARTLKLTSLV